MTPDLKNRFGKMLDEVFEEAVKKKDGPEKEVMERAYKVLSPTVKAAELDLAATLLGPDAKGHHTFLGALAVKDGQEIEKLVKEFSQFAAGAAEFTFDVEKIGDFNLHKIVLNDVPPEVERIFGTKTVWVAVSNTHVAISMEPDGTAIRRGAEGQTRRRVRAERGSVARQVASTCRQGIEAGRGQGADQGCLWRWRARREGHREGVDHRWLSAHRESERERKGCAPESSVRTSSRRTDGALIVSSPTRFGRVGGCISGTNALARAVVRAADVRGLDERHDLQRHRRFHRRLPRLEELDDLLEQFAVDERRADGHGLDSLSRRSR